VQTQSMDIAIVGAVMGAIGGLVAIPFSSIVTYFLKRFEQDHQHKLNLIEKKRELYWTHKYQISSKENFEKDILQIKMKMIVLDGEIKLLKAKVP
jgi:hypothetical protein